MNNIEWKDKVFSLLKNYDSRKLCGSIRLSEESEKILSTGEYVIVPSWVNDVDGNRIIEFGLIHEDTLVKKDGSKLFKD